VAVAAVAAALLFGPGLASHPGPPTPPPVGASSPGASGGLGAGLVPQAPSLVPAVSGAPGGAAAGAVSPPAGAVSLATTAPATAGIGEQGTPAARPSPIAGTIPTPVPTASAGLRLATPGPTPRPAATPTPAGSGGSITVTLAQDGSTVHLALGQALVLDLGTGYVWTLIVRPASVLVPLRAPAGAQAAWTASQAGTAEIAGSGDLPCRRSKPPCMAPSRAFSLTVVVG